MVHIYIYIYNVNLIFIRNLINMLTALKTLIELIKIFISKIQLKIDCI
jgi:hypothetical protein